jgi:hypothetical protein
MITIMMVVNKFIVLIVNLWLILFYVMNSVMLDVIVLKLLFKM